MSSVTGASDARNVKNKHGLEMKTKQEEKKKTTNEATTQKHGDNRQNRDK